MAGAIRLDDKGNIFISGYAFTEDHVPIHKLYMSRIHKSITLEDLVVYFSQYGELDKVMVSPSASGEDQIGLVTFVDAIDAAAAMDQRVHVVKFKPFLVEGACSWLQPNRHILMSGRYTFPDTTNEDVDASEEKKDILSLPDECLTKIFKTMNIREQIMVARTCTRFLKVLQDLAKEMHEEVYEASLQALTLWELRSFFMYFGESIRKFQDNRAGPKKYTAQKWFYIRRFCTELRIVHFDDFGLDEEQFRKLCHPQSKIRELAFYESHMRGFIYEYAAELPELENFIVFHSYCKGKGLKLLKQLKRLSWISDNRQFYENYFIAAFKVMKNLRFLDVCIPRSFFGQPVYRAITTYCTELEHLWLYQAYCTDESELIATHLPKLRELFLIDTNRHPNYKILPLLVRHKVDQLEKLCIRGIPRIDTIKMSHILKLKNLKLLDVGFKCKYITNISKLKQLEILSFKNNCAVDYEDLLTMISKCKSVKLLIIGRAIPLSNRFIERIAGIIRRQIWRAPFELWVYEFINQISRNTIMNVKPYVNVTKCEETKKFTDFKAFNIMTKICNIH